MIVGIGIDLVEVERVKGAIERHGQRFVNRIYTGREIQYCESMRNKYQHYAARFAVKEAAFKALGVGWQKGVAWREIEVTHDENGKPLLWLYGKSRELADRLGVRSGFVSISHSGDLAIAEVILSR